VSFLVSSIGYAPSKQLCTDACYIDVNDTSTMVFSKEDEVVIKVFFVKKRAMD